MLFLLCTTNRHRPPTIWVNQYEQQQHHQKFAQSSRILVNEIYQRQNTDTIFTVSSSDRTNKINGYKYKLFVH